MMIRPSLLLRTSCFLFLAAVSVFGQIKVALVEAEVSPSDPLVLDVKNKLLGTGRFSAVDVIDAFTTTPTLAQLQGYKAVLVWSDATFLSSTTLGNNLADYVDGGGGVVLAVFANSDPGSLSLGGRWTTGGYDPLIPVVQSQGTQLTLGVIAVPASPLMNGVTTFNGGTSSFNNPGPLAPGATLIASYSNGVPLVATKSFARPVVALNFWPPSNGTPGYPNLWLASTNGTTLMANALYVASNTSLLPSSVPALSTVGLGGLGVMLAGFAIMMSKRGLAATH